MTASSVTGAGQGSADRNSPPNIKNGRVNGPRILMSGVGQMLEGTGGETTIRHPELPEWEDEHVIRIAVSCSAHPVYVSSFNSTLFIVNSQTTDASWTFYWMIVAVGVSNNLVVS